MQQRASLRITTWTSCLDFAQEISPASVCSPCDNDWNQIMREMVSTMVMVMKNGYDERKCKDDDAYKVDDDEDEYNTRGRWM